MKLSFLSRSGKLLICKFWLPLLWHGRAVSVQKSECSVPNRHVGRTWLLISCSTSCSGPLVISEGVRCEDVFLNEKLLDDDKTPAVWFTHANFWIVPNDRFFWYFPPFSLEPFTRFTIHRIGLFVHLQMVNDLFLYWATNQLSDFNHLPAESCQLR